MKLFFYWVLLCISVCFSTIVSADIYIDAVGDENRSKKDKAVDDRRKPVDVMRFFEIKPKMKVLDVFAGGGYYSELLSSVVGKDGKVTLYNNEPWDKFVAKSLEERLKDNRLPNVEHLVVAPESLIDRTEKYDAAIFILGMHDIYYADPKTGWVTIDKRKFLKGIYHSLNDGAVLGVIDANAETGVDNEKVGKDLHRVDPAVMIKDIIAAGFELEATSDILSNPDDDKVSSVFLPKNRYNTDRSVLKFRKK